MSRLRRLGLIGIIGIIVAGAVYIFSQYRIVHKDLERLRTEAYDTVFFSMYATGNYAEEDWMYFRGMDIVKTDYSIPNNKVLQKYIATMQASGNIVTRVYLGVDPKKIAKEEVVLTIQQNPTIHFEVVLAYPQIEYWTELSTKQCQEMLQRYQVFAEWIVPLENADLYFFGGEEWLTCNPKNYDKPFCTNASVSKFLMCNFDIQHSYLLTMENVQSQFNNMQALVKQYRETPITYPDGKDVDIVFIGDSIIGNYTDSLSVPEVVGALTGARVFNLGYGGKGAAQNELTPISFPEIVDIMIEKKVSALPQEAQLTIGMQSFLEKKREGKQLAFVINFGLNDYFSGVPIEGKEELDITSYEGALRSGIKKLQKAYPQAQIIMMTPNFTVYYECGRQRMSEQGGILEEYAQAVQKVAAEAGLTVVDNFYELPITEENWRVYQEDGCHLNERGRFLLGSRIAQTLNTN